MRHLNYNHLLYFWTVVREGSVSKAAAALHLTPQTISGQIKLLEGAVGEDLFQRVGRGLVPTATGRLVMQYADGIFSLGAELAQRMRSPDPGAPEALQVGVVNSIAKLIAWQVLEPALADGGVRVVCTEGALEDLLGDLAVHRLDLVLSDRPKPTGMNVKAWSHALGSSGVGFFAAKAIAGRYRKRFPGGLDGAPFLLPTASSNLRRGLDDWFEGQGIRPRVVAEFDDSALLKAFGEGGAGIFPAPLAIQPQIEQMYGARCLGPAEGLAETYYALSPERRLKHSAVVRITAAAAGLLD